MGKPAIKTLLAKWQKRLRVQDWRIDLRVCRVYDMPRDGVSGYIEMVEERKEAIIYIIDPRDVQPSNFPNPTEVTLVHELLHLLIEPCWDRAKEVEGEQAVELIAQALVATDARN